MLLKLSSKLFKEMTFSTNIVNDKALNFPKVAINHERSGVYELHFSQKTRWILNIKNTIENCIMKALANI
jgi:hypothetical protein